MSTLHPGLSILWQLCINYHTEAETRYSLKIRDPVRDFYAYRKFSRLSFNDGNQVVYNMDMTDKKNVTDSCTD